MTHPLPREPIRVLAPRLPGACLPSRSEDWRLCDDRRDATRRRETPRSVRGSRRRGARVPGCLDARAGEGSREAPRLDHESSERISFERDTYTFTFGGSPSEFLGVFREYYGPTMNAYAAAAADGREDELHAELDTLFNEQNTSSSPDVTSIPATFLGVTSWSDAAPMRTG
jgi:hypothetical protein